MAATNNLFHYLPITYKTIYVLNETKDQLLY